MEIWKRIEKKKKDFPLFLSKSDKIDKNLHIATMPKFELKILSNKILVAILKIF